MRLPFVIAGVLGLVLAGGIVVTARVSLLPDAPQPRGAASDLVDVYVARVPIAFGTPLSDDLIAAQPWPRAAVPHMAITDPAMLFSDREGARVAKGHFVEGEVLIASKLSAYGDSVVALPVEAEGRRAMAVRVRGEAAEGGLIAPGDLVDIVFADGAGPRMRAVTLLSAVRVLSAGQTGLLTLEVTADQAQSLALAQQAGVLVATLRLGGSGGAVPDAIDLGTILGTPVPATGSGAGVVVRRGGETSIEPVQRRLSE